MKPAPDNQLLFALQQTVTAALKQWLDENKTEIFRVMHDAVLESETASHDQRQQQVKRSELLTVAELAQRWHLHPESVRRMIRQGRVPRVVVGRQSRIAVSTVEKFEKNGAVPSRR